MVKEIKPTQDERIEVLAAVIAHRIQRRQQFEEFHRLRRLGLLRYYDTTTCRPTSGRRPLPSSGGGKGEGPGGQEGGGRGKVRRSPAASGGAGGRQGEINIQQRLWGISAYPFRPGGGLRGGFPAPETSSYGAGVKSGKKRVFNWIQIQAI